MTNDERKQKLKDSLPYMKGDYDPPAYAKIKIKNKHSILKFSIYAALAVAFIIFICNFVLVRVNGHSMDPTLHNNQYFIAKRNEKPKRFEIVVLKERIETNGPEKTIVKRVIGLPGDTVSVIGGRLFINNREYSEKYLDTNNIKDFDKLNWTITVPKNHIFVLGDNRDISKDSRSVGCFKVSAITGVKL